MAQARIADASDPEAIREAARIIREGGLVAFPTETVYGLGASAENEAAVARIFEAKRRPRIDPLIVHVSDMESARRYGVFPNAALPLMERFWPGPLTLVAGKTSLIPYIVTAGLDTVAVRIPAHPAALALIRAAKTAIAAPSANPFGYVSPTEAEHVAGQLGDTVDFILDGGPSAIGVESTILSFETSGPVVLRAGGTPVEDLQAVLGRTDIQIGSVLRPSVPGQMKRHYSTRTPLEIREISENYNAAAAPRAGKQGERIGLLTLSLMEDASRYAAVEILSPAGDVREAAAGLFRALRRLDALALDRIVARPVSEKGLGLAIMDRLRRCAAGD
ncbi:MAG: threonylcarbamoyl-AMP synthase [Acidobacteriota bacterium]|nr:threonylcarbamoyl-AMP synthase [Acidobacteriota bacterium]